MNSKTDTCKSQANSIENMNGILAEGYSLKKYRLKCWIYDNEYTQPFVARTMGIDPIEFKRMLREREKFSREQLWKLIKLMGAEEAFNVLYFPSKRRRRKIWWEVFGKYRRKEELNE